MNGILLWVGVTLLVVLGLALKVSFLGGLAAIVSRWMDSDNAAVSGRWRLRAGGTGKVATHSTASCSPQVTTRVAGALREFVERDVSWPGGSLTSLRFCCAANVVTASVARERDDLRDCSNRLLDGRRVR